MTEEQKSEYLKNGGSKCPFCGYFAVEGLGCPDVEFGAAYQRVSCPKCGRVWLDEYVLVNAVEIGEWKEEDRDEKQAQTQSSTH